ncbi:hypothetical protein GEV33_003391 [Tenebrio molitor]|uniref:Uncharacterized protein n=1 Tax=Tenebrio molitor TaxID=7067 RepID=A0A8J6HIJ1_TENMO|nr:hypothetical protein GEV33_003391 [Tenebrio molitor]
MSSSHILHTAPPNKPTPNPPNRTSTPFMLQETLTRIEENIHENECHGVGRRPSIKVDNWDFIYTETKQNRCPIHSNGGAPKEPPELPLDARKTTTLRRHYYLEGGWGWVVVVCSVLVHVLNHGVQLSCSQLILPGSEKFKVEAVHFAGEFLCNLQRM